MNNEQMDFLCSFLHKSIYKSLIPENFLVFDERLEQDFDIFNINSLRIGLLEELLKLENVKKNEKILDFINEELKREKIAQKLPENNAFCHVF